MTDQTCVPKLLFNKDEAALAISYKARALDYAIASGELPVIRHGNRVYVSREALETFASKDRDRMTPVKGNSASEDDVDHSRQHDEKSRNTPVAVEVNDGGH
jgi:hypothetical protein